MRLLLSVLGGILATSVCAQPLVHDSFDGTALSGRWTMRSSREATVSLDPLRQVVIFTGPENQFNHIETALPGGADYLQVDICSISDASASWAPSLIVYWDEGNWVRLMISLFYHLRTVWAVDGEHQQTSGGLHLVLGTWYRCAMKLEGKRVRVLCGEVGDELREVAVLPRPPSWAGTPRVILGKGYMPPGGGNPDFANNYYQGGRVTRVACDDFIIGDSTGAAAQLGASLARRELAGRHNPDTLQVAFWPQVTRPDTRDTIWWVPDLYQRLSLLYCNFDSEHVAPDLRFELELPEGLGVDQITLGTYRLEVEQTPIPGGTRYELHPTGEMGLPPQLHGVDYDTQQPGWFSWPHSTVTPELAIFCRPRHSANGALIRARAKAASGAGPWTQMTVRLVEPLPALVAGPPEHLGLSIWGGDLVPQVPDEAEILDHLMATWARVGVHRVHTRGRPAEVAAARAHGIAPFLFSWWHYSTQCPREFVPTPEERATTLAGEGAGFCPQVIGAGSGTYGRFLEQVTTEMARSGCVGFMLDYECSMPLCFDQRCRQAFIEHSGRNDVNWPADVQPKGRYHAQWVDLRCWQGAQYVRVIGDAARRAVPDCAMQAWVVGYDYRGSIVSAQIDVSKAAEHLTEVETPHYTLPADYSDMWAAERHDGSIEAGIATVEETLAVVRKPIIFCSSIIYPCGGKTRWSDPQLLDVQIQAIIAAGARGLSFWGGHCHGGADGRFMHKLVKWHNLLAAAGEFLWHGQRRDELARVNEPDTRVLRRYLWAVGDRRLLVLVNLSPEERTVSAAVQDCGPEARMLLTGAAVDLSRPVTVPSLDGVWLTLQAD